MMRNIDEAVDDFLLFCGYVVSSHVFRPGIAPRGYGTKN